MPAKWESTLSVPNIKRFAPILFYALLVAVLFPVAVAVHRPSLRVTLFLTSLGLLSWELLEYVLHRFVFHLDARRESFRQLIYYAHLSHHDNPKAADKLFASLSLSVPIATAYFLSVWVLAGKWESAVYLWSGLVAGYLFYEWLHYQAHHGRPRVAMFRYLKTYHLLHHHATPDLRFGVSSPVFDYLFGTYRPARNPIRRVDNRS